MDTLLTLGYQRRYTNENRIPVEPPRDTVITLRYYWDHHEILYLHNETSGGTMIYCSGSRVTLEPPQDAAVTQADQRKHHKLFY